MTTGKTQDGATSVGAGSAGAGEETQPITEVDSGAIQAAALKSNPTEAAAVGETAARIESSPTSLTPGSGRLAALLAEKRANAGKIDTGPIGATAPTQERSTPAGAAFDALEITAVGGPAGDKPASFEGGKPSGVVRQTRLTPGSGKIAALLAQTRAEATRPFSGDPKAPLATTPARVIPPVTAVDEPGITEVDSAARDQLADSEIVPVEKSSVGEPRPTRITPVGGGLTTLLANTRTRIGKQDIHDRKTPLVAGDGVNVSTAGVVAVHSPEPGSDPESSSAQVKNSGFAATLQGVPAPVVDPSGAVDLITERNAMVPGDTSEATTFGEQVSVDQGRPRSKEPVGEAKPKRRPRVVVGLSAAAAMVVVAVVLVVPRNRVRPEKASLTSSVSQPTAVVAGQLPSEPSSLPPAAISPTADQPVGINPTPAQSAEVPAVAAPEQAANPAAKPDQPAMEQPAANQPPAAVPSAATAPAVAAPVGAAVVPPAAPPTPTSAPATEPAAQVEPNAEGAAEAKSVRKSEGKSHRKSEKKFEDKSDGKQGESPASEATAEDVSSTGPGHKVGSRVHSRGAETRKASARTNRKKPQISNPDAEEFVRAASTGTKSRQKGNPTSAAGRSPDEDPDAVLPLSRH